MAYVNFNDIDFNEESGNNKEIKFFSLKQDKESAVVRFIQNSTDDFEIVAVHEVEVQTQNGPSKRKVNCLRGANEPIEKCPFCETNQKLQRKFFVHLVKYEQTQNGIVAVPMVWERPLSFAKDLANKIQTYGGGPLSDHIFKITRNGAPKDKNTTYTVDYLPPQNFPENIYPKNENAFANYSAVGGIVLNKTAEDMIAFVRDGKFPFNQNNNAQQTTTNSIFTPVQNMQGANFAPVQGVQNANNVVNNIPNNPFFNPANGFNGGAIPQTPQQTTAQQFVPNQQFTNPEANLPWNNGTVMGAPVRKN